ncbi:MAG TPA: IclR family transcriptional regulator C-terminal domain-containing protein [Actinophytocola sp.]|nr:IclR family transcriptional regulator C-terminal domain-containing protein [Actinophytocola sp.]
MQRKVLDQLDGVCVERLVGPQIVRIFRRSGQRLPAHATSTGKVLLAHLSAEILQARLVGW